MIEVKKQGQLTIYSSDNGEQVVASFSAGEYIISHNGEEHRFTSNEEARKYVRSCLHAISVQDFLKGYKGIISHKWTGEKAGVNINYLSHLTTGLRNSSPETAKRIEDMLRQLGKVLVNINII